MLRSDERGSVCHLSYRVKLFHVNHEGYALFSDKFDRYTKDSESI